MEFINAAILMAVYHIWNRFLQGLYHLLLKCNKNSFNATFWGWSPPHIELKNNGQNLLRLARIATIFNLWV
jgi:hypothetical protein